MGWVFLSIYPVWIILSLSTWEIPLLRVRCIEWTIVASGLLIGFSSISGLVEFIPDKE